MKKIITLLITLIFIASCIPAIASEPIKHEVYLGGDNYDYPDSISGDITVDGGEIYDSYDYSDASGGTGKMLYISGKASKNYVRYETPFNSPRYKCYTISLDIYFPASNSSFTLALRPASTNNVQIGSFFKISKTEYTFSAGGSGTFGESIGRHCKLKLEFDLTPAVNKVFVYVDNQLAGYTSLENYAGVTGYDMKDGIRRIELRNGTESSYIVLDNLEIYGLIKSPSIVSHSSPVNYNAEKIDLNLSGEIIYSTLTKDAVKLSNSDGDVIELDRIETSDAGGILSLYPKYNLDASTSYTVTIPSDAGIKITDSMLLTQPVTYTFTTESESRSVTNTSFVSSSGEVIFEAELSSVNPGEGISVILTLWDGNKLIGVNAAQYTYDDIISNPTVTLALSGTASANKAKVMIVDDFNNAVRIGKPIYEYPVQ